MGTILQVAIHSVGTVVSMTIDQHAGTLKVAIDGKDRG